MYFFSFNLFCSGGRESFLIVCESFNWVFCRLYMYVTVTIGYYVQSTIQATIYLIVGSFLFVMSMWSLAKTLFTRVGRVPERYRPSKELEDRLKAVTPMEKNRYVVEKSTPEQVK